MKIGILTGGGDCPGLNPVIRAVVRKAIVDKHEITGIKDGWRGMIENNSMPLNLDNTSGILHIGGTILGTSRTNPYKKEGGVEKVKQTFKALKLGALIAVGGEDTLGVASRLVKEGLNVVGVPKTIDNDLDQTEYTFGFDTAVNIAMEAIDRLHTTACSHHRVLVVEIMGRHAGWIALHAGIAGGADSILLPEKPIDLNKVCDVIKARRERGKLFSIIAVAEGAQFQESDLVLQKKELDAFGHVLLGGIGATLAKKIEEKTKFETRYVVLGHTQRGGSPTAFDRVLGTRFGVKAVELVNEKKFGYMVCLQANKIVGVPIEKAVAKLKIVEDREWFDLIKVICV
ncbi:MAG: 6-phosphofructokinase [Candidatus Omnitrophica bacterium CG12_big_fil_rev_8_21_14_0_65_43_15]|uniref:Pyrophosphate--fructose 6-phosphate 1-phosphotransferase n=1 Tax=Candidatus Taenaricola geysiri TaxID=1974752 RepID=A0A2J0LFK1_9BACT|nr:MAG: 6-phosphofructokinase [Candidatus Omnitrophica bacterium CG1_02_43_210]PIV11637.1 MAG: 6-phosphofructokinase [Candidatus Omnitrophica bacterium CG03_land_8_20_14_0_80_43_22]PIW66622.1 MAG: 6-phosphofructokinase [Candidatus Omnitrophica bacterium CG12_big_fil_rev_8_21_14_0_65_43_15]PIW80665.1 MAG: 6-phosphofructokinase [Candidatus Omnitrophica bacterium CG_4_8_14_3_um_filter_43_15]PIY84425.1 MAG: 6-phosphofructokinase [Candidatus Omnitrophica bacterium CG_4_10_14_0_8_um_filter_43_18]PJC